MKHVRKAQTGSRAHVFISFKTQERDIAHLLTQALTGAGFAVWWQENLQCGQEWHGEIDRAISQAGAIVVLWSQAALASPWVRHEASQASAMDIYAPVRIEPLEITSPYDRIQATDIMSWAGEVNHPGFQNLLRRLDTLMPQPIPVPVRLLTFAWNQRATIVIAAIAGYALMLLVKQSDAMKSQTNKQDILTQQQIRLLKDVNRTLQPIEGLSCSVTIELDSKQPEVVNYLARLKSRVYDKQDGTFVPVLPKGAKVLSREEDKPAEVLIKYSSFLWPSKTQEPFLQTLLSQLNLSLVFAKNKDALFDAQSPQLRIGLSSTDFGSNTPEITWNLLESRVYLTFAVAPKPELWQNTSEIVSIPDLEDSYVSIQMGSYTLPRSHSDINSLTKAEKLLSVHELNMKCSGKAYHIRTSNMYRKGNDYYAKFRKAEGYYGDGIKHAYGENKVSLWGRKWVCFTLPRNQAQATGCRSLL